MSPVRKILRSSMLSLILVTWGLFMVCSGQLPEMYSENDWISEEDTDSDFLKQLASLDEEATELEENQKREILEALGIGSSEAELNRAEEDFLTEELFLDLEIEISELENLSNKKSAMIDSLKVEMRDVDHQLIALNRIVKPSAIKTSSISKVTKSIDRTYGATSEYSMFYQDAMDEVHTQNYPRAIEKFRELLRGGNANDLADNCQYWIGECYYALGNYQQSIAEFEKVFAFDSNNKTDDAQFMIGIAYIRIGELYLAQLELSNLLAFYNKSEYVTRAERRLTALNI